MYDHDRLVNARAYGARGDGQADDTAAIVGALGAAQQRGEVLYMPRGRYLVTQPLPAITWQRGGIVGDPGGTRIKSTAPGVLLSVDGGAVTGAINGPVVRDLDLEGNVGTTIGLHLRACVRGRVSNVRLINATQAGILGQFVSLMAFEDVVLTVNEEAHAALPEAGIKLTRRGPGEKTTACSIVKPCIEGLTTGTAIDVDEADMVTIDGGALQGNQLAVRLRNTGGQHRLQQVWCEANAEDILVDSFWCVLEGVKCNARLRFGAQSYACTVRDGSALNLQIDENTSIGDQGIVLDGIAVGGPAGTGQLIDNGRGTRGRWWNWGGGAWAQLPSSAGLRDPSRLPVK